MEPVTVVMSLMLLFTTPEGNPAQEFYPVTVPVCQEVDGVRVEDSSCGIRNCLLQGRERAAVIWGRHPGTVINSIMCIADDGASAKEGSEASGGHPALNMQKDEDAKH